MNSPAETTLGRSENHRLLQQARDPTAPWAERVQAALGLDRALRSALDKELPAAEWLCLELGLIEASSDGVRTTSRVAESGYAARSWPALRRELARRLAAWPSVAEADVELAIRRPSRLVLARHLIPADEVVAEVRSRLRISTGARRPVHDARGVADIEARRELDSLPAYERRIVEGLFCDQAIYWLPPAVVGREDVADDSLDNRLFDDDLVEQPPGTVVLVVRPPASDWELEIKRTGLSRDRLLSIAASRVPSHRLAGASTVSALTFEAEAAASFAVAYRHVHGVDADVSRVLDLRVVLKVPSPRGEVYVTDYFTDPGLFGDGHAEMRSALKFNLEAHARERKEEIDIVPGDFGESTAFLQLWSPAQAALSRTSAWRLDGLADRLSASAPEGFRMAPELPSSDPEVDDLAALVVDGGVSPARPSVDRVGAILAANRDRARANYHRLLVQVGRFWGTLLGLGGHSQGESLVGRNVGLRRRWQGGRPRVEVVFMDHDNLYLPATDVRIPPLGASLAGLRKDELALFGGALRGRYLQGTIELLERIFRVTPLQADAGRGRFWSQVGRSHAQTRRALRDAPALSRLFHSELAAGLEERDALVRRYLDGQGSGDEETDEILCRHEAFLRRRASLFEGA